MARGTKRTAPDPTDGTRTDDEAFPNVWERTVDELWENADTPQAPPTEPVAPPEHERSPATDEEVAPPIRPVTPAEPGAAVEAARPEEGVAPPVTVLRLPRLSLPALVLGWVLAWGAIAIITSTLERAGVATGFNLGIAEGGLGDSGFRAGLSLLIISGVGFLVGGYGAARMARVHGTKHGVGVAVIAMAVTGMDGVVEAIRDGTEGVLRLIPGVPFWGETGMTGSGETALVLAIFAVVSLVGSVVGGALGQAVNRVDRTTVVRPG